MSASPDDAILHTRRPEPELTDLPEEADAYARADFAEVNAAFVDRLLEVVITPNIWCLDLGTGPADIPLRIAGRRPGWRILAVDGAWPMLEFAGRAVRAAGLTGRVCLMQADAKALALRAGGCDAVISNSILHHVSDPVALWGEVRRIVRPGGWIFFRDLARPATESAARRIVAEHAGSESALLQEEFFRSLLAAYRPAEVMDQLHDAGLNGLRVEQVTDRHLDIWGRRE